MSDWSSDVCSSDLTLEIRGSRIRLHGIDAPESGQHCTVRGDTVRCGREAAFALDEKIASQTVSCHPRDRDRYNRIVAVCPVSGTNLNAWMVASGWALPYRPYPSDSTEEDSVGKNGV